MRVVAVIPARFAAVRLPGKPLSEIHGKPMIQWVYERVRRARGLDEVIVATDDQRIASVVEGFGGRAMMEIRITLLHEFGHYLGFEEEDMERLGLA
jgi:3-deoxy-manno-octulosonate cytidylyltransferase (CMP-KDO synthetase)